MHPELIAHRGEPDSFPENSLAGYEAVLGAGAAWIETDVQITRDGIPVLSHDPTLLKITGDDRVISETPYAAIRNLSAGYPERFGERFRQLRISRLDEFACLLAKWPRAQAFVEFKQESTASHGRQRVIDIVLETLGTSLSQCILISFDYDTLQQLRRSTDHPVAWVLPEWSPRIRKQAESLQPEYLFCNHKRLPQDLTQLWQGPWTWAIYTVNTLAEAREFAALGAGMVETNAIRRLMQESRSNG